MSVIGRPLELAGFLFVAMLCGQPAFAGEMHQHIHFPSIAPQIVGVPLTLVATTTSGLPLSFKSSPSRVCSVSGTTASFAAEGDCYITATQPGNGTYAPARPVTQAFRVYRLQTTTQPTVTSTVSTSSATPQTLSVSVKVSSSFALVNGGTVLVFAEPFGKTARGTVADGVATVSIGLPEHVPSGTYPVAAVFLGTPEDFPSVGITTFTVSASAPPPAAFTVGGAVSGLPTGQSVTLLDNGGNPLSVSANGIFVFTGALAAGSAFNVTISAQPSGAACTVSNGSGTIAAANVTNVVVSCATAPPPATFTVGGTVSGLPTGQSLTLLDNGGNALSVSANGTFAFTTALATGSKFNVTVSAQPSGEVCTVANGSGTIAAANVSNVAVSCASTATTGSTAFSALSVGNARIAMVPLNLFDSESTNTGVAPVAIDGTTALTGSFIPSSFPIQACSTDSANLIAVCINYSSATVAVLNFSKFVSTFNIADIVESEYNSGVPQSTTSFSGASCVICGVVAVPSLESFIVSAFDGYHVYPYPAAAVATGATLTPTIVYSVPIAENFTLSNANGWLISPDYLPQEGTRPLRVIDLVGQKAYTWTTFTDNCGSITSNACTDFSIEFVDAAAFDETTKILVLNDENGDSQLTVDLSQAVFNAGTSTFTAPSAFSDYSTLQSQVGVDMSGILASSVGHWSFTIAEFGDAIVGVSKLPAAGGSGGSITLAPPDPTYLDLSHLTNYAPCNAPPVGGRDPHAQGYTLSSAGIPLGLLVSGDSTCVAVINFAVLATAPTLASPDGNVVNLSAYDPVKAGAITLYAVPAASSATAAASASAAAPAGVKKRPVQKFGAPLPYR